MVGVSSRCLLDYIFHEGIPVLSHALMSGTLELLLRGP